MSEEERRLDTKVSYHHRDNAFTLFVWAEVTINSLAIHEFLQLFVGPLQGHLSEVKGLASRGSTETAPVSARV